MSTLSSMMLSPGVVLLSVEMLKPLYTCLSMPARDLRCSRFRLGRAATASTMAQKVDVEASISFIFFLMVAAVVACNCFL